MTNEEIKAFLQAHADAKYASFNSTMIPGTEKIIGVRIPVLRELAKTMAKEDWRTWLDGASDDTFEETMLQGLVTGYAKMPFEEQMRRMAVYAGKISDWALCDCPCTSFKFVRRHREEVWQFLQTYLASEEEFAQRFAVVMLLTHYVTDDYVGRVLDVCARLRPAGYYAMMAVAWAVSVCYVKYPSATWRILENGSLDDETQNKAIQKIVDSFRVSKEDKCKVRTLKR